MLAPCRLHSTPPPPQSGMKPFPARLAHSPWNVSRGLRALVCIFLLLEVTSATPSAPSIDPLPPTLIHRDTTLRPPGPLTFQPQYPATAEIPKLGVFLKDLARNAKNRDFNGLWMTFLSMSFRPSVPFVRDEVLHVVDDTLNEMYVLALCTLLHLDPLAYTHLKFHTSTTHVSTLHNYHTHVY